VSDTFQLLISGDFLNEDGVDACGGLPLKRLNEAPRLRYQFLKSQAPRPGDASYWQRFYSLEVAPRELAGAHGLILLRPWLKSEALEAARETLCVVARSGAGYDKVDLRACTACDVALTNAPLALNHSTASTALLFMLALAKRLLPQDHITRAGRWDLQAAQMGHEIAGRTLGIIGLGHSGQELARLAAPFGMRMLAYSPHAEPAAAARLNVELTALEAMLRESDFVSIHARPRPQNHHLIGAAQLALMKPTAYLINVSRGELIDEQALVRCLQRRAIAGAALDVFEVEPVPAGDALLALDNVIVTPHWNASTWDVWQATGQQTVNAILSVARGEVPQNVVNPEVLSRPGFQRKLARWRVTGL
jgi:phosphoglycerate dehydrogenase-like enzyme